MKSMKLLDAIYPSVPLRARIVGLFKKSLSGEPPQTLNFVGGAPFSSGASTLRHLINVGGLRKDDRILDIGCGIGRVAAPLQHYLDENGHYCGMDIVREGIDWCCNFIIDPRFAFTHLDVYNSMYNKSGKISGYKVVFPYLQDWFTFVFANSVFTHMLPEATSRYLQEIARVSKAGVRTYLTFFLLNEKSLRSHDQGKSAYRFPHVFAGYRTHRKIVGKEGIVAYEEGHVRKLVEDAGLKVGDIKYGSWSWNPRIKSDEDELLQDVVLVTK